MPTQYLRQAEIPHGEPSESMILSAHHLNPISNGVSFRSARPFGMPAETSRIEEPAACFKGRVLASCCQGCRPTSAHVPCGSGCCFLEPCSKGLAPAPKVLRSPTSDELLFVVPEPGDPGTALLHAALQQPGRLSQHLAIQLDPNWSSDSRPIFRPPPLPCAVPVSLAPAALPCQRLKKPRPLPWGRPSQHRWRDRRAKGCALERG